MSVIGIKDEDWMMTRHQQYALAAMQAIIGSKKHYKTGSEIAYDAFRMADAMINREKELEQEKKINDKR